MAMVKDKIKADIKQAFTQVMDQQDDDRNGALDKLSGTIADAVMAAVASATITYTAGLTAPAGGGPVTGTFNCKIS